MYKEKQKEYQKSYRDSHKKEKKEYNKDYYQAHKEKHKARCNAWYQAHKEEYMAYHIGYTKTYNKTDSNSFGVTKNSIRNRSNYYLFNILKHTKLKGYEIHHCFGYDDYKSFVYIPKELHLQIHQFLRDNEIIADSNHFSQIVHLINAWNGYTYIKV